jgi:hypothetical protein
MKLTLCPENKALCLRQIQHSTSLSTARLARCVERNRRREQRGLGERCTLMRHQHSGRKTLTNPKQRATRSRAQTLEMTQREHQNNPAQQRGGFHTLNMEANQAHTKWEQV